MPRTRECDYCGDEIEPGTGTLLVRNNGSTIDYCSSKCEKNADLDREPRDVEWTQSGRGTTGSAAEESDEPEPETEVDAEPDADDETDTETDEAAEEETTEVEEREEEAEA